VDRAVITLVCGACDLPFYEIGGEFKLPDLAYSFIRRTVFFHSHLNEHSHKEFITGVEQMISQN
jgi:hypothetical protein